MTNRMISYIVFPMSLWFVAVATAQGEGGEIKASTITSAGVVSLVETSHPMYQVRLGDKIIKKNVLYPSFVITFKDVEPFKEVVVIGISHFGSTYANQDDLQFLGIRNDGSYEFSEVIPYDLGDDPMIQKSGDLIEVILPGGGYGRHGYNPPAVWIYEKGKIRQTVSEEDTRVDTELALFVSPKVIELSSNLAKDTIVLDVAIRNMIVWPVEFIMNCPAWEATDGKFVVRRDPRCVGENITREKAVSIKPGGFHLERVAVELKGLSPGIYRFQLRQVQYPWSGLSTSLSNSIEVRVVESAHNKSPDRGKSPQEER